MAVGGVVNSRKMAKHFAAEIRDGHFAFQRRTQQIKQEARLDGIYVIRTSVPAGQLDANEAVQAYKDLVRVERAFRSLKTIDLDIRPIRHWTAPRVRAHVFLCMLAYHVEWHRGTPWHRCCSMTPSLLPRGQNAPPPSSASSHPSSPRPRRRPSAQPTVCASWASLAS
jgi:hypothetical protein